METPTVRIALMRMSITMSNRLNDVSRRYPVLYMGILVGCFLSVWVDFYNVIAPYSTSQTLDHALISKICTDYEIRFTDAFYWLSIIHQEVIKKYDHTRDRGSKETDESEGRGL